MKVEIIAAEEKHIPQIMDIETASFTQPWTEGGFLREMENDDAFFAVAEANGEVLGFLILHKFSDESELYKIAVSENARRSGIADLLMFAALEYILKNDIGSIFLEVRAGNLPAIRLYEKHGFFSVGRRPNYYEKPTEDAVIMVRSIYGLTGIC